MKTRFSSPVLFLFAAMLSLPLAACGQRVSPTATVDAAIDGHALKIVYARPHTQHPKTGEMRQIWGGLVPYGKVWRTGANEATTFTTDAALMIDGHKIPAGTYTLYSIPTAEGGELVINEETGQWGTVYHAKRDLARVAMTRHAAMGEPVHQFTMAIKPREHGGVIQLIWEDAVYETPFTFAP